MRRTIQKGDVNFSKLQLNIFSPYNTHNSPDKFQIKIIPSKVDIQPRNLY